MTAPSLQTAVPYDLARARQSPSRQQPASHQRQALSALQKWFDAPHEQHGGILVLPTGGGKTFTAQRFLTTVPLSRGHKVLWLAHTHHLLDQAALGFGQRQPGGGYEVGHVREPRRELILRAVSGTPGHARVADVRGTDDVLIITLQSLARAVQDGRHAGLGAFLKAAASAGLTVVFDECHHAPAPSYQRLLGELQRAVPGLHLLGLTATPDYTDERRKGWLPRLFPQGLLYQVDPQTLMAQGILSRPRVEECATLVEPQINEEEVAQWVKTYRDVPEHVIQHLAQNVDRNALIVQRYAEHRERYGQTIVFADRWYQCLALVGLFRARGVQADAIFSKVSDQGASPEERNARTDDDNARILQQFRDRKLEVLVNIRMLTEGTDVPGVQTVFLTRQTTSRILLTQMIGRALRGPKFGGTAEANVVAFIDQWKGQVNWARWDDLLPGEAQEDAGTLARDRLAVQYVSGELVERLAREMNSGEVAGAPFLSLLPVGWYAVSFDAAVTGAEGQQAVADDIETVRQLIPVYDQDLPGYEAFFASMPLTGPLNGPLDGAAVQAIASFGDLTVTPEERAQVDGWTARFFPQSERLTRLDQDLLAVLRHAALRGAWPELTPFEARDLHDLDALARQLAFDENLGTVQLDRRLRQMFVAPDRLWQTLYPSYALFKGQFDQSVNRELERRSTEENGVQVDGAGLEPEPAPAPVQREPSSDTKAAVLARDGQCLCCGATARLQVDHIVPVYLGGSHDLDNLQLLCGPCNRAKGTRVMDFRGSHLIVGATIGQVMPAPYRADADASDPAKLERYIRRCVNMYFGCAAVQNVTLKTSGKRLEHWVWIVTLRPGNLLRSEVTEVRLRRLSDQIQAEINVRRSEQRRVPIESLTFQGGVEV